MNAAEGKLGQETVLCGQQGVNSRAITSRAVNFLFHLFFF
jgi:hypothetical protein